MVFSTPESILENLSEFLIYSAIYGYALWYGNGFISDLTDKIEAWNRRPVRRLIYGILATIIYSAFIIIVLDFAINVLIYDVAARDYKIPVLFVLLLLLVTFIISITIHGISFFKQWKNAILREEQLKFNMLELEYSSLKNQVNPHFLFNSLNALTGLVEENEKAVKFIKKLSDVYRYLLEHRDEEIVNLSTEIEFLRSYLYLLKIRFEDNLHCEIDVKENNYKIVPPALQILTENAVKHNVISKEHPLKIKIFCDNEYIIVENSLLKKEVVGSSHRIGLENLKKRYKYLSDKELLVHQTNEKFIVKIPILKFTQYERNNY